VTDGVGRALAAACADLSVLARIGGGLGNAARAEARSLATVGDAVACTRRAAMLASARSPVPPGLRGVDPTWIEAALADLPARARVALAEGPEDARDVWLVRRACAGIPPLPAIDPVLVRPRVPADVLRLSAAAARAWLEEVGLDQLAFALGEHAAALGPRLAPAIARIGMPPRTGELGPRRAAIERARVGLDSLLTIGARAIAPSLEPGHAAGLVRRFPRPEGLRIAADLAGNRGAPAPSWGAVIAS
jgi:hypothetical protein